MKFGPVGTGRAEGAVLAHSVSLGGRRRLRKGRVLNAGDIAALTQAGIAQVTVARLEPGDIFENAAAAALAAALVPDPVAQHVRLTDAFTGRVNLLAVGPGVVVMDVAAIEAANCVHPMITIATVPPHQQMARGGMIATIKIISYAVPDVALRQACVLVRAAIRLAPPVLAGAGLIVTEIEAGAGIKGRKAIADRINAFGLTLQEPVVVPHQEAALSRALLDSAADLTMILTGSATSDVADTAPAALRQAGGRVIRFGMPVDPGNLLFIGDLAGKPVIGLPGCARSPALNGADWVLARIICGVDVSESDIAAMGVGGLLKEIPTRPQPRAGKAKSGSID